MRLLLIALLLAALVATARAEALEVRSGEHPGFSRLVFETDGAQWALGRHAKGYELRVGGADLRFDLDGVFGRIPRTRVADIREGPAPGTAIITLACDCHAKAFVSASGALVIDIADGPPEAPFPFETSLPDAGLADPAPPAPNGAAGSSTFPLPAPSGPEAPAFPPHLSPLPLPAEAEAGVLTLTERSIRDGLPSDPPTLFAVPDPRVAAAQAELLRQLGRAASQGLVEIDRHPDAARPPIFGERPSLPSPLLTAETGVDRAAPARPADAAARTGNGGVCPPDAEFDLAAWGDDRPAAIQIAERRAALLGEFDRVSNEEALSLARLYLFLGFGAEARATGAAFEVTGLGPYLDELAATLDGTPPGPGSHLAAYGECDGPVAFWALLANPALGRGDRVAEGAILRTFASLPPHLRRQTGPDLIERFLALGSEASARAIRNAMARAPGDGGPELGLAEARIDLASGAVKAGEDRLAPIARTNAPQTAEAVALAIGSRLARDEPVDPTLAESAGALAYEHKRGPDGPRLARLHILALASSGAFRAAFGALDTWPGDPPDAVRHDTARDLFARLTETASDDDFLSLFFEREPLFDAVTPDILLRLDIAERLGEAGFSDAARRVLAGEAGLTERGRRIGAGAALQADNPDEALGLLATLGGAEADRLRAAATAMKQSRSTVLMPANGSGAPGPETGRSALPEGLRIAITALDPIGPHAPQPETPLAASRSLLEDSRRARDALAALLAAAPLP